MNISAPTRELANFGHALSRYFQILRALMGRELARRRDAPGPAFFVFMEPLSLIVGVSFVYWLLNRHFSPVGGSPILFFATGLYIKYYFIHTAQRMRATVKVSRSPAEIWMDHVVIFVGLRLFDYVLVGICLMVVLSAFVDSNAIPSNPIKALEAMGFVTMLAFGWGVMGVVLTRFLGQVFWHIFSTFNRMLLWVTGAMFVVDFMPPATRHWISFIPTAHAIILFRQAFYPNYPSLMLDMPYLIATSVGFLAFGLILERAMRRYIER